MAVVPTLSAHTIQRQTQLYVHASLAIQTQVQAQQSSVKVCLTFAMRVTSYINFSLETCQVNNGGCDANALCSYDGTKKMVVCTCKTGYTNTGSNSTVVCTGSFCR